MALTRNRGGEVKDMDGEWCFEEIYSSLLTLMGVQQNSLQFTNYFVRQSLISLNYSSMAGDLKSCRYRGAVEHSSDDGYRDENHLEYGCYKEAIYKRSFDHHVPVSVTSNGINPSKRLRPSSFSAARCSKPLTKRKPRISCSSSRGPQLRIEELQFIKRELKVIKNQIDDLLNSLEHMGTRNTGSAAEGVFSQSQFCSSVSGMEDSSCSSLRSTRVFRERQSLEPRETRDEERQMKTHESKLYCV